jgi:hypothetical protein
LTATPINPEEEIGARAAGVHGPALSRQAGLVLPVAFPAESDRPRTRAPEDRDLDERHVAYALGRAAMELGRHTVKREEFRPLRRAGDGVKLRHALPSGAVATDAMMSVCQ